MKDLPARQQDVLNMIVELTDEKGFPPSLAELAAALGLKNRMTVHQHVAALKKKGLVHWESGLNRSLRVVEEGLEHIRPRESETSNTSARPERGGSMVPLHGKIAAGVPIDAIQNPEYLGMESDFAQRGCYALQVKGDSMIEDGIFDGDFVIIKPNPSPTNGDIVVALLEDGSATLKRFFKENGRFRLQPANCELEPIYIDASHGLEVQGVVVGLFRKI
jgi:SOS regulatory protein LexA